VRRALLVLLVAACGSDPAPVELELGGLGVRVEPSPARLQISAPDGTVLLDGLLGGTASASADDPPHLMAAVRASTEEVTFLAGAFKIDEDAEPWRGVATLSDLRVDGEAIRFTMNGAGGEVLGDGQITAGAAAGSVVISLGATAGENHMSLAFGCTPDEHFLGFGGQSYDVDHRGQTVPIFVEEDGITKAPDDFYTGTWFLTGRRHSTHTPMPIYLSSRGYAAVLETSARSIFSMCSEADDVVRVESWEPRLVLRVFHGESPTVLVERLTAWLGRPALPPAFAFAPWLDAILGSDNVRRVAAKLRAEDIPSAVIWTEDFRGGAEGSFGYELDEDWGIDRDLYPDFEAVADDLHDAGFKLLTYVNTFITEGSDVMDEALAGGYTIRDETGAPYLFTGVKLSDTTLLDLSNPTAVAWASEIHADVLRAGADGWMADFAEWLPTDAVLFEGDARLAHNRYPADFQRMNRAILDEVFAEDGVERLFFVRSASLGSQPLVSVVWGGDQQTDFTVGDGFPSVIPIGIGLGVTGFPFYGHDIGGYMSQFTDPTSRELFFRWTSLGALSPVMRTHHGRELADNWSWERDAETIVHFRRWAKVHMRLFPYLQAMAEEGSTRGLPMMRPLALGYPAWEPGWTLTDQFLLGDRIIVAPVVTDAARARTVALPPGTFYPLDLDGPGGGPAVSGTITAGAPLEELPAFVPAGTLLVLLPPSVDTVVDTTDTSLVTLTTIADDRELFLWPGGVSSFTEVGGLTYSWSAASLTGRGTSATWNGASTPVTDGSVTVTGAGTLVVDGVATLTVSGGAADRELVVRLR
jgi:sulfoquinovosidase